MKKKRKISHFPFTTWRFQEQSKYTKLGSFTCSVTDKCISIMTKEMTLRNLGSFKLNR